MDDPPMAHPWVQAGKMPAIPANTPMRRGGSLRARASRPHPAGGRQWTTRRWPTRAFKRARCPRSQETHPCERGGFLRARAVPASAGGPARNRPEAGNGRPAEGPPVGSCGQDARDPRKNTHAARGVPASAGVPPAPGRRPAMDDPPMAHPWVQAGKMPAIPGKTPMRRGGSLRARGVPASAGVPPAPGRWPAMDDPPKAHPWVQAGKMPAIPGNTPMRRGGSLRARGVPASAGGPWERGGSLGA